jgi:hypothetical protein
MHARECGLEYTGWSNLAAVSAGSSANPSFSDMTHAIRDLSLLLRTLRPERQPGVWAYATCPHGQDTASLRPLATFREVEAVTVLAREEDVRAAGLQPWFRCAWIALSVHSDLEAVGLTAAVATALTARGISCNVVAAAYHDHLFVPVERAEEALDALIALQRDAAAEAEADAE